MADSETPTEPSETQPRQGEQGEPVPNDTEAGAQPTRVLTAIRERSPVVVIAGLVLALVVGGLIGGAIGIKFEQGRAKDDIKRIRANAAEAKKATGVNARVIGLVTKANDKSVTVAVSKNAHRQVTVNANTIVELSAPATSSALTSGSHVVWKNVSGTKDKAVEVIVLPAWARTGVLLTGTTSTSMTYHTPEGNLEVDTSKASIHTVSAGRLSDVAPGTPVLVAAHQTKDKRLSGVEIIVLPKNTKFGQTG